MTTASMMTGSRGNGETNYYEGDFLWKEKLKNFLMEHIYHVIPDILMIGVYI